jgi:hypothetical protein
MLRIVTLVKPKITNNRSIGRNYQIAAAPAIFFILIVRLTAKKIPAARDTSIATGNR